MTTFNVYYQNTRGLRTKTHTFKRNLNLSSYDVVSLTETWLLDGISDSELFDDRYLVWRRDRDFFKTKQTRGGGVLLAVRRDFSAVERPEWTSSAEDLWVTVTFKNKDRSFRKLHFCTIYLCNENVGNSYDTQLGNFAVRLSAFVESNPNDTFIIMGDFNMPMVDWTHDGNYLQPSGICGETQIYFFDTLSECNLNQFSLCRNVSKARILDLILCNEYLSVTACDDPLVPEDAHHRSLNFIFQLPNVTPLKTNPRKKYYFESGNYDIIKSELKIIKWKDCLSGNLLDEAIDYFYSCLYDLIDKHVPCKFISSSSSTFPPWYNASLKKILKEKRKYQQKYRTYGNHSDYETFSLLRKRSKAIEADCYQAYIKKTENSIVQNPKLFWTYIKSNKKGPNSLPPTLSYEGQTADTSESICNIFAIYFQSTFLSPSSHIHSHSTTTINHLNSHNSTNAIGDIEIDPDVVLKALKSLDLTKGPGPDRIPPIFIVNCANALMTPLTLLFTRSVKEGTVPSLWKSAFITPVHKNGNKGDVKNYRPISKLCLFAKILERLVYTQVYSTLLNTFIPEQHGFLRNRSTVSNLLLFTDFTTSSMDAGGQVDSIFTDYSKAFDRIDHKILLQKLLAAGIHGNLFRWFTSYIENRSQAVTINGFASNWHIIPSGVPQGSLLGPLLFNIFINDISSCFLHSKFLLYADDMKIFKKINSYNDCCLLQQDLIRFEEYCQRNSLDLNVSKCHSITFTRKFSVVEHFYKLQNTELKRLNEVRDLGVIHDSKLLYEKHIDHIAKRANRAMGFIKRSCSQFSNVKAVKILYCSYVRSILEYCSQIWNPQYDIYVNRLECVQRKFMRFLQCKCKTNDLSYAARCKRHHMMPLKERRTMSDISTVVKIAQSIIDSPHLLSLIRLRVPTRSARIPSLSLYVPHCATNYRQNSFIIRSANCFNELVGFPELDIFNSKPSSFKRAFSNRWFESGQ